jgi:diaminopimelate epimerase
MGRASFRPADLPCALDVEELVDQPIRIGSRTLRFTGVSVGNPHCVVFRPAGASWEPWELRELGPPLETHHIFPRFTNVQLAAPVGRRALQVLIWERGAGETLAGGALRVEVGADYAVTLDGPVAEVARGRFSPEFLRALRRDVG